MLLSQISIYLSCALMLCLSSEVSPTVKNLNKSKQISAKIKPGNNPKRYKRKHMLQAYKTYTERNCLQFKDFVKKVKFKPRTPKLIENSGYLDHLEELNENELMELLSKLESDLDISELIPLDIEEPVDDIEDTEHPDDYQQNQKQEASQQVHAEIHTHSHYYLLVPENGTIVKLPTLAGQNLTSVQNMLSQSTTTENLTSLQNMGQSTTTTTTETPFSRPTVALSTTQSLMTSTTIPFSTLTDRVPIDMSDFTTPICLCPSTSEDQITHPKNPYRPIYTNETQDVTFTTLRPDSRPATSTVQQTTLPPVEVPTRQPNTIPSTTVTYPPGFPVPDDADGAFTCGGSSSGSTTNFVSPNYPNYISETGTCDFYLVLDKSACQVRVDFVDTDMLAPKDGSCIDQELTIQGTIWPLGVQSFCGRNDGQHFYIEVKQDSVLSYLKFTVSTKTRKDFKWGLWITQLRCNDDSNLLAPSGCFQYHFRIQDVITSFNYAGGQYYSNQNYRICILASNGKCAIKIETDGPFMLEKFFNYKTFPYTRSGVSSTYCVRDYILIPGGQGPDGTFSHDRFCGGELSSTHGAMESEAIYSQITSRLVTLEFHSAQRDGVYYTAHHVGFRLIYTQVGDHCSSRKVAASQELLQGVSNLPKQLKSSTPIVTRPSSSDTLLNKMMSYYLHPNEPRHL
eukprot:TRINITY_DN23916_c0_g1_i1.p1 TRINITY_DN23916_c0_g1~~TRINITY_DN23916_c0_g1_i1.p1  ORF type:complete len:681 (+),score=97.98 TRINITY_DN23916_c0_g1_i1:151-2193(+)